MSDDKIKKILLVMAILGLLIIGGTVSYVYLVIGVDKEFNDKATLSNAVDKMNSTTNYRLRYEDAIRIKTIDDEIQNASTIIEGDYENNIIHATFEERLDNEVIEEERYMKESNKRYETYSNRQQGWTKKYEEKNSKNDIKWHRFYKILENPNSVVKTSPNRFRVIVNSDSFNNLSIGIPPVYDEITAQVVLDEEGYITNVRCNLVTQDETDESTKSYNIKVEYSFFNKMNEIILPADFVKLKVTK